MKLLLAISIIVVPMAGFVYMQWKLKPQDPPDQSSDTGGGAS